MRGDERCVRPDVTVEAEDEGAGLLLVAAEETHAFLDTPLPRRRHLLHELRHKQQAACTQWLFVTGYCSCARSCTHTHDSVR